MAPFTISTLQSLEHERSHIESLPAELRNHILQLALVQDGDVDIKKGSWPSVLVTCKQLRSEGMPVFLGNNTFIATVRHLDGSTVSGWLSILRGLEKPHKRLIKSLAIRTEGDVLDVQRPDLQAASVEERLPVLFRPTLDFWNSLIEDLKAAGFTGSQIKWPGLDTQRLKQLSPLERICYCVQTATANQHILTP